MKLLPRNQILHGDAGTVLANLLPESVDACVTSPPYFAVRDYKVAGQLGQEATIEEWVANLRGIFRQVARILKPTGSLWLNVGDTFSRHHRAGAPAKSMLLAPERLLLALARDGWRVRGKVVWAKPNPLPESAADRLSRTHEYLYHLVRDHRYFFDLDSIREPHRSAGRAGHTAQAGLYQGGNSGLVGLKAAGLVGNPRGKNPGDVWTIPTAIDRLGHQATFPPALVEPAISASVPERICTQCDRAWTRPTRILTLHTAEGSRAVRRVGELERCDCFAPSRPGIVLDPFFGTGTVGLVAENLNRDWLGIELNRRYIELADARLDRAREAA